jgi:vacuole morphology and inheritance protein 14
LNDSEKSVVHNVMDVLTNISLHDQYFDMVIDKILEVFYKFREIQEKKSELIVKKLCS